MVYLFIALLSVLFGILLVGYLTSHPIRMSLYLAGGLIDLVILGVILMSSDWVKELWAGGMIAIIGFVAGYLGMTSWVLSRKDDRPLPELTRLADDPGLGHTAILYFTHGEPETYDPIGWLNQFREFDEQKIPFVPFYARPFFIYGLRNKYLRVGRSEHRSIHHKMIKSLEETYRRAGDKTTRFYLSFLDDDPRPGAATIQALNDGASRIVVSEVFLTVSNHTAEGRHQIEKVLEQIPNLPVRYTGPLYDSLILQKLFVERANQNNGFEDKSKIGILLVGHGQPDEWDREWPTETEQEIKFRLDVLKHFEADGYRKENMSLAWMEFKEPKPAKKIEEFVKNGVREILYFPAAISADSLHSQYDIPELVHQARIAKDFPLKNLGAWNDDPLVIQALKVKVDQALGSF